MTWCCRLAALLLLPGVVLSPLRAMAATDTVLVVSRTESLAILS
jgi:phosphatidate phosphatase PAH1